MNSKEALKSMCNHCEKLSIRDGFIGCPYRCISNDYCEEFETIEKDLEVLEMLKKKMSIGTDYYDSDDDCKKCEFITYNGEALNIGTEEVFNKIKEWLEDENNK